MPARQFLLFLVSAFALLYLTYAMTVIVPYVNHDSVRYFHKVFNNKDPHRDRDPQYLWVESSGRPVAAALEQFLYKNIRHLSDLSTARLASIACFALAAAILGWVALTAGRPIIPAFCLSVAVFTLPGIQESIFVPYLFNTLPILGSLLAFVFWQSRWPLAVRALISFVLLEAAFFTYPSSTYFFLVPVLLLIIYKQADSSTLRKEWLGAAVVWLVSAVSFYILLKIFYGHKIAKTHHEIGFTGHQIAYGITHFPILWPQLFNLWNIYYSLTFGLLLLVLTAACVAWDFWKTKMTWRSDRLAAFAVIFIILNAVWFLFGGYQPRVFIAAQAAALILVDWSVEWLTRRIHPVWQQGWPVVLMLAGLMWAANTVIPNVWNNNEELMFLRNRIVHSANAKVDKVFIVLKNDPRGYNGLPVVYDNLNNSLADYEFPNLIRAAVRDLPDKPHWKFDIVCIKPGETFTPTPDSLIIDMNDLVTASTLREATLKIQPKDEWD